MSVRVADQLKFLIEIILIGKSDLMGTDFPHKSNSNNWI